MKHDPGPISALTVALIIGVLYTQGGIGQLVASLLILAVLLAPHGDKGSLLSDLLHYLNRLLTEGIQSGA